MKVELWSITSDPEKFIERCGRTCYKSSAKITSDSYIGFIKGRITQGHYAILEHAWASFNITGSRVMTHQLVRHRQFSYLQESQRYCDESLNHCVIPDTLVNAIKSELSTRDTVHTAFFAYQNAIKDGIKKEDARYILPQGTATEIIMSGNFRMWFEFLQKRLDKHAHWEIRSVAKEIYKILHDKAPNVFNIAALSSVPKYHFDDIEDI